MNELRSAAWFFAAGVVVHNGDHLRRGTDSVTAELFWAGNVALVISAVVIVLALRRHPAAPRVAMVAGPLLAAGFAAAHLLPTWSVLSDSFVDGDVSAFSWAASLLEIAGALLVGVAGAQAWRARTRTVGGGGIQPA